MQVTDVILTHSHFDHIGSAHHFPNAKIYINSKELEEFQNSDGFRQFEKIFEVRKFRNQIVKIDSNHYLSPEISIYFPVVILSALNLFILKQETGNL